MKKMTFIFALVLNILSIGSIHAQYQNASYNYISLEDKVDNMLTLLSLAGYEVDAYDVAELSEGDSYFGTTTFYGDSEYIVIAISEYGVEDLDISISNTNGTIAEDMDAGDEGTAIVEFFNRYDRRLDIEVENYESSSTYRNYDFVVIVAYK